MPKIDESAVRQLYQALLEAWNRRDAGAYARLFSPDGYAVGFDGTTHDGPAEIESDLSRIFADHPTATYVGKVRDVRMVSPHVAVLRAVAGMVRPGETDLFPPVNAIQSLVAVQREGEWSIAAFQNTPAAFHGRPELAESLTEELRAVLRGSG
ncbi:MAG TPA: SgcJ/EcaC family oxidoreductase [Limnochordia bacterium]